MRLMETAAKTLKPDVASRMQYPETNLLSSAGIIVKQHQVIAWCNAAKTSMQRTITDLHHKMQKLQLFSGLSKRYRPKDEEGDLLPEENTKVQTTVVAELREMRRVVVDALDALITLDATNCAARADIDVDGVVLVTDVPVTTLLALEKILTDWHTFFDKLPVLDTATDWYTGTDGISRSMPFETVRTKKVPIRFVRSEATDKHPAQVDVLQEDVIVGYWTKNDLSGALPVAAKTNILRRLEKLRLAGQAARSVANSVEAPVRRLGAILFDHVTEGVI